MSDQERPYEILAKIGVSQFTPMDATKEMLAKLDEGLINLDAQRQKTLDPEIQVKLDERIRKEKEKFQKIQAALNTIKPHAPNGDSIKYKDYKYSYDHLPGGYGANMAVKAGSRRVYKEIESPKISASGRRVYDDPDIHDKTIVYQRKGYNKFLSLYCDHDITDANHVRKNVKVGFSLLHSVDRLGGSLLKIETPTRKGDVNGAHVEFDVGYGLVGKHERTFVHDTKLGKMLFDGNLRREERVNLQDEANHRKMNETSDYTTKVGLGFLFNRRVRKGEEVRERHILGKPDEYEVYARLNRTEKATKGLLNQFAVNTKETVNISGEKTRNYELGIGRIGRFDIFKRNVETVTNAGGNTVGDPKVSYEVMGFKNKFLGILLHK